jgi:hypothetical protein
VLTKQLARYALAGISVYGPANGRAGSDDPEPRRGQFTWPRSNREISARNSTGMSAHRIELSALGQPVRANSSRQL